MLKTGVPFTCAYALHFSLNSWQHATPSIGYACTKCLPIVVLMVVVLLCRRAKHCIVHLLALAFSGRSHNLLTALLLGGCV